MIVNFIDTVPPLVRFSSCTTTFTPLVSPSAEAMPAGAAAAGAVPVAGAAAGGGAGVVAVVAVGAADDDVAGAGSFFEQARSATAMRRADAIDLLMSQSKLIVSP